MPRRTRKKGSKQQSKRGSAKKVRRPAVYRKLRARGMPKTLAERIANKPAKKA